MIKKIHLAFFFCFLNSLSFSQVILFDHRKENSLTLTNSSTAKNSNTPGNPAMMTPLRPSDLRIILTRILQTSASGHNEPDSKEALEKIKNTARAISSFQPTLVSQVLLVNGEGTFSPAQIEAFQLLQKEVLLGNPHCKFEIKLNVTKYSTASEFIAKLQEIDSKMGPDIVTFVIPKKNEVVYPSVLEKGIEYLHSRGQLIGYEGPTSMIPDDIDFLVMVTENGDFHREEIASLRTKHHLPIVVRVSSSFWKNDSVDSKERSSRSQQQAKLLTHLAEEQSAFGYHFVYPFLGAALEQQRDFREPTEHSLLITMRALMTRYN